jgi:hypothetical protein
MKRKMTATISRPVEKATCIHHWLIEPAIGPISCGVCKYCGERKNFFNILDEFQTDEEISVLPDKRSSTADEDSEEES